MEILDSSARLKRMGNQRVLAILFRKPKKHNQENSINQYSSKNIWKRSHKNSHEIDVGSEIVKQTFLKRKLQKQISCLFGDDITVNVRMTKATYSLNQPKSRRSVANCQSNMSSLTSQGRKKNFAHQTGQSRFPHQRTPDQHQKHN